VVRSQRLFAQLERAQIVALGLREIATPPMDGGERVLEKDLELGRGAGEA